MVVRLRLWRFQSISGGCRLAKIATRCCLFLPPMKFLKFLIAISPAVAAHFLLIRAIRAYGYEAQLRGYLIAAGVILLGGIISGIFVARPIRKRNVERNPLMIFGVGAIICFVYVIGFGLSGALTAIINER